jgi:hypothetical protein
MLKTKFKWFTVAVVFLYPLNCMAAFEYLYGYDFGSCTEWEFTTDGYVENFDNSQYKAAVLRLEELKDQNPGWVMYVAINHKTYGEMLYGVCRRVDFQTFECQKIDGFPLSGTFTAAKGGGQFSSTYHCTKPCSNPLQQIFDQSSEDGRNSELEAAQKKFEKQCPKARN